MANGRPSLQDVELRGLLSDEAKRNISSFVPGFGSSFGSVSAPKRPALVQNSSEPVIGLPPTGAEQLAAQNQALINQQRAQLAGQPDVISLGSGKTELPVFTEAETSAVAAESENIAQARVSAIEESQKSRVKLDSIRDSVFAEAKNSLDTFRKRLAGRSPALRKRAEDAEKAFDEINAEVKSSKLDPERLLQSMPTWANALINIGVAFDTLSRQIAPDRSVGPSLFALVQGAINRDLQIQRIQLNARLQQLNIADRERQFALSRFDKIQEEQRDAANSLTQLKLSQIVASSDSLDKQLKATDALLNVRSSVLQQKLQLAQLSRPKRTRGSQETLNIFKAARIKSGAGVSKLTPSQINDVGNALSGTDQLLDTIKQIRAKKESTFGLARIAGELAIPFLQTASKQIAGTLDIFSISGAKAAGAGQVSVQEMNAARNAGPKLFSTNAAERAGAQANFKKIIRGMAEKGRAIAETGDVVGAQSYFRAAANADRALREIEAMFQ